MKKALFLSFMMVATSVVGFADSSTQDDVKEVVRVENLTRKHIAQIEKGKASELAVEFPKGEVLSVYGGLQGGLLTFIGGKQELGAVHVKETFYARMIGKEIFLSADLTEWKPLLSYITGNLFFSVEHKKEDETTRFVVEATVNKRS